jgi:hypothetical protein
VTPRTTSGISPPAAAAWAARANLDGRPRELGCDRVVVAVLLL